MSSLIDVVVFVRLCFGILDVLWFVGVVGVGGGGLGTGRGVDLECRLRVYKCKCGSDKTVSMTIQDCC